MTRITRNPDLIRKPRENHRLAGQVAAVDLLSELSTSDEAEAPAMFTDALGELLALTSAGDAAAAADYLDGLARILGPAIRDGVVASGKQEGRP
jgi:hypothetical protein